MKFTVKSEHPASAKTGCVILGVFERRKLSEPANRFDKTTRGLLARLLANGDMDGKSGQTLLVHHPHGAKCERVLLVGCGKAADFNSRVFGQAVASAALAVNASGASDAVSYLAELEVKGSDQYRCRWSCNCRRRRAGPLARRPAGQYLHAFAPGKYRA
jgi:leucyl aminopeptidase